MEEWKPEPLVPPSRPSFQPVESGPLVISGPCGLVVKSSRGERLENWSSHNFLGLQNNEQITEAAIETVRGYGVGACGPAGFYGSMDVHLNLERQLARLLEVEEAIVYAQGFMAVASVIPAFCKRGDIIVADDGVSFAGQTGLEIARSHIYFFAHNDMSDLERVLQLVDEHCRRKKMPLSRRFILVEGLYAKYGDKCPLPEIIRIKHKYKYRLIIDETLSFGTLGPRRLGITDHYGIPASDVEIIAGSFSASLGSSGGFCAGAHAVVDHQRLSSQAYCFSAALPALLAVATSVALDQICDDSSFTQRLSRNMHLFNQTLLGALPPAFVLIGDEDSPLRLLQLLTRSEDESREVAVMDSIVSKMRKAGYLLCRDRHVESREKFIPPPLLKICISAGFSEEQVRGFSTTLLDSLKAV